MVCNGIELIFIASFICNIFPFLSNLLSTFSMILINSSQLSHHEFSYWIIISDAAHHTQFDHFDLFNTVLQIQCNLIIRESILPTHYIVSSEWIAIIMKKNLRHFINKLFSFFTSNRISNQNYHSNTILLSRL